LVAHGSELGLYFIIRPATAGTDRGSPGFNLLPQVVVIYVGLAALLDVAVHQLAHDLGRRPIFADCFIGDVSKILAAKIFPSF
jgi:hypothetical protein